MRLLIALFALIVAALSFSAAIAFPDGAPWGAANPAADQNCATCHFGDDPVLESPALALDGLPDDPRAGESYELEISFEHPGIVIAGFQLFAQMSGEEAGRLVSDRDDVEFIGSAIRSTVPVASEGGARWTIEWRAPDALEFPIVFYLAASAANDDGSPFGDTIHFRSYRLLPGRE